MDKKPAANGSTGHEDDPLYNIALESLAPLLDQQQSYTSTQSSSLEVVASQSQHVELSHAVRRIENPNNIDVLSGRGKRLLVLSLSEACVYFDDTGTDWL